jgi:hypothetical protein
VKNFAALSFVVVVLAACGTYTYQNTHPRQAMHPRQTLMPAYPAAAWDEYVQHGGAFRGRP